ncbi:MAG: SH3 domain-containing protein, partial [Clostridia bacterium]|nr:SH3 domain-containing protein [Clostridia bacterium]
YQRGIASNHGDPEHLWSKFGLQMDGFRADVAAALRGSYRVLAGTYPDLAAAKAQARTLLTAGFSATVLEPSGNEITLTRTGTVRVNTSLNIRSGPGTGYSRVGSLKNGDTVTLIDERDGWGALLQGGWVSLDYIINA